MRLVISAIISMEKQELLHILSVVCSLSYAACNAHVPFFMCCLPGSKIFFHVTHKWYDFRKKVIDNKICFYLTN